MSVKPANKIMKAGFVDRAVAPANSEVSVAARALGNKRNTGRMDRHTRGIVSRYQLKNNLPQTREIDAATWAKLGL